MITIHFVFRPKMIVNGKDTQHRYYTEFACIRHPAHEPFHYLIETMRRDATVLLGPLFITDHD